MTVLLSERLEPLMEKPGWQRALILTGVMLALVMMLYLFGLRGMWQQQEELKGQIATTQRGVSQAQVTLLRAPSLDSLESELQGGMARQHTTVSLAQHFAQPLKDSQARLVRWQPASGEKTDQQGDLHLQLTFSGLTHFLYVLLQQPEHPAFSELSVHADDAGLNASVQLTRAEETSVFTDKVAAVAAQRDPFGKPGPSFCTGLSPATEWILSGVSHAQGKQSGWLLSANGLWVKVESGSQFGTPQWTVETLDASQIALRFSDTRCGIQRQVIRLGKGKGSPGKGNNEIHQ